MQTWQTQCPVYDRLTDDRNNLWCFYFSPFLWSLCVFLVVFPPPPLSPGAQEMCVFTGLQRSFLTICKMFWNRSVSIFESLKFCRGGTIYTVGNVSDPNFMWRIQNNTTRWKGEAAHKCYNWREMCSRWPGESFLSEMFITVVLEDVSSLPRTGFFMKTTCIHGYETWRLTQ